MAFQILLPVLLLEMDLKVIHPVKSVVFFSFLLVGGQFSDDLDAVEFVQDSGGLRSTACLRLEEKDRRLNCRRRRSRRRQKRGRRRSGQKRGRRRSGRER
ncbi:unnamed protein product [Linum trigynum]|uniref:Secreted protein n=1 Tax=Linum trigynum TaxID=586398 RepID=A0AAV2D9J8_9ROSI